MRKAPNIGAFDACSAQAAKVFNIATTYQPAGRYWPLQAMEFGLFAILALACAGGCYWWVTRRGLSGQQATPRSPHVFRAEGQSTSGSVVKLPLPSYPIGTSGPFPPTRLSRPGAAASS